MNEITIADPCVLFALRREGGPFRREFRPQQRFPGAPCRMQFCGPAWLTVLVVETGMGAEATERALRWLLQAPKLGNVAYRPKVVLSAGFAGALRDGYQVGDIILASEVVDQQGGRWPVPWPAHLPAGEWRPPLHGGRLVTVSRLIGSPEEKRRLGQAHQALAVDMESAVVARLCQEYGVPFGCVRVISDTVQTALSERLVSLLADGRIVPWRVLGGLLRSPRLLGEFWRLRQDTRIAAEQLGKALGELLTLTLDWAAD